MVSGGMGGMAVTADHGRGDPGGVMPMVVVRGRGARRTDGKGDDQPGDG
jgi:hypothetical protein